MVSRERLPLAGIRVVDLTRFVSGAYAGSLLAALGADVIKLEFPPSGDAYRNQGTAFVGGESALFGALNTGKRSVLLDPEVSNDRATIESLLVTADVFLENGRPGSLERIRLDAKSVRERHPHIIYASISGYGQQGPDASLGGFDLILQAEAGLMSVTGEPESGPVKLGVPALDIGSAISCALVVVSALYRRKASGDGAIVSSSLLEFALATFTSVAPAYFVNGEVPDRLGSHSPTFAPYGAFRARDGYIVLAGAGSEELWKRLCAALEADQLVEDPRFVTNADRVAHLHELVVELELRLTTRDREHWLDLFSRLKVPAAEVRDLHQVLASAQVQALEMLHTDPNDSSQPTVIGAPFQVDGPLPFPGRAPRLGEHTNEVLAELALGES